MIDILNTISRWAIPLLFLGITTWAISRGVSVYESFVEGAKEGFHTAVRILPYLVAMLVAIQIFHHSGALDRLTSFIAPLTSRFGIPSDILPLALMRPLSGSGSLGILAQILETHGPDSIIGYLASTIYGSTETTFYVLTVYTGAVGVKRIRHSLITSLVADIAGFLGAIYIVLRFFA